MSETRIGNYKHPVKNVNQEILDRLSLESNKVHPLPGGSGPRIARDGDSVVGGVDLDPRLIHLKPMSGLPGLPETVPYYEHVATIRFRGTDGDRFFVAFRQTMDALLAEQQDPDKYPEWLMKDPVKRTELKTYIYLVKRHWRSVENMTSFEDWLAHIADPMLMDTLAYFLLRNEVITQDMYGRM